MIKASATLHSSQFDALAWFEKLAGESLVETHLVHAGPDTYLSRGGWKELVV